MTTETLALRMREVAEAARDATYKREETLCARYIAEWEARRKKIAEDTIARLPQLIRAKAESGKTSILLQIQISPPMVYGSEIKSFRSNYGNELKLRKGRLTVESCRGLPHGSREIARWAIRQGLIARTKEWDVRDDRFVRLYDNLYEIDSCEDSVLPRTDHYSLLEGLVLEW